MLISPLLSLFKARSRALAFEHSFPLCSCRVPIALYQTEPLGLPTALNNSSHPKIASVLLTSSCLVIFSPKIISPPPPPPHLHSVPWKPFLKCPLETSFRCHISMLLLLLLLEKTIVFEWLKGSRHSVFGVTSPCLSPLSFFLFFCLLFSICLCAQSKGQLERSCLLQPPRCCHQR